MTNAQFEIDWDYDSDSETAWNRKHERVWFQSPFQESDLVNRTLVIFTPKFWI